MLVGMPDTNEAAVNTVRTNARPRKQLNKGIGVVTGNQIAVVFGHVITDSEGRDSQLSDF